MLPREKKGTNGFQHLSKHWFHKFQMQFKKKLGTAILMKELNRGSQLHVD